MQINIYKNPNKISKDKILFLSLKHLQYVLTENMGSGITYAEGGWVTLTVQSLSRCSHSHGAVTLPNCFTYFRGFSIRIISFCIQNVPFRFELKHAKPTLLFAILHRSFLLFRFASLRFTSPRSEMRGHPISNSVIEGNMFVVACQSCCYKLSKER